MKKVLTNASDFYKYTHAKLYSPDTEVVYSYFEARKGATFDKTVFFGLQQLLIDWLEGVVVTKEDVERTDEIVKAMSFGTINFDVDMWNHIVDVHGGKLPIRIKAVPEGTVVPIDNVMMTVENTDIKCYPLTNFLETILTHVWYASTVATKSKNIKNFLEEMFEKSADTNDLLPFMLHDFGFRGVSSFESAGMGGAAHLINFMGTDTMAGVDAAVNYYNGNINGGLAASVVASEHSIMTSRGEEGELQITEEIIDNYPNGILSLVADSYNIENFVKNIIGVQLKDKVLTRDGKVVIRPDSPRFKGDTPEDQVLWIVETLEEIFGTSVNNKGFKILNPKVGVIYGDGLSDTDIHNIYTKLIENGYGVENCVCGQGGGLLQKCNRDTQRFAFKSSAQKRNGVWYDVYKKPLDITKASKKGKLKLILVDGEYKTVRQDEYPEYEDQLVTVFENGEIVTRYTFDEVKENSNK